MGNVILILFLGNQNYSITNELKPFIQCLMMRTVSFSENNFPLKIFPKFDISLDWTQMGFTNY